MHTELGQDSEVKEEDNLQGSSVPLTECEHVTDQFWTQRACEAAALESHPIAHD